MTTLLFDTLAYSKKLKEAGFTAQQAEALAETQAELIDEQLATKRDLRELEERLTYRLEQLAYRLTLRLGSMLVVAVGVIATLVKLL